MRIITISRQFGSGGRELGIRLAVELGFDFYDREIIEQLANQRESDQQHVRHILNNHAWKTIPTTYRNSFSSVDTASMVRTQLMVRQREIIEDIAATGNDCVIVGRDADIILREYKPLRIFVCADMDARLSRCMLQEMEKESDRLSEKEVLHNIRRIDKERCQVREVLTGREWSDSCSFDMTLNSAGWDISRLASVTAAFARSWFAEKERT